MCALLRAGSLGVIRPVLLRSFDVATLSSLFAATQQDDQSIPDGAEVHTIAVPNVDPKLLHTIRGIGYTVREEDVQ